MDNNVTPIRPDVDPKGYILNGVGTACVYTDEYAVSHPALFTAVWGIDEQGPVSANVVYVSGEQDERDQYGRQIRRQTSVVRRDRQAAHGRFFELV
jgi:hypothetical protein